MGKSWDSRNIDNLQQQFFALLRGGIGNCPAEAELFSATTDWDALFTLAKMQTVSGVLFEGIAKLPPRKQPQGAPMRKLYQTVIRIEQSHELLNRQLSEVVSLLRAEGIRPVLLKGQGAAQNYPHPARRQCGDIDLYVGEKDYRTSCEALRKWNIEPDKTIEGRRHYNVSCGGITVELHRVADHLWNPVRSKRFQHWTQQHLGGDKLRVWSVNGADVLLPPVNFDALYIFSHAYRHFIEGGVGLRQLCDWTLFLHTFSNQINRTELFNDLKSFGLLRAWQIFGCIAVDNLGLREEEFPFYTPRYKKVAQKGLMNILREGNFGFYTPRQGDRPPGYFSGKLHSFRIKTRHLLRLYPLAPGDVSIYFLNYLSSSMGRIVSDALKPRKSHG